MGCPFRGGGQKLRSAADPLQIRCGPAADPVRSAAEAANCTDSDQKYRSRLEELEALYAHAQAHAQAQAQASSASKSWMPRGWRMRSLLFPRKHEAIYPFKIYINYTLSEAHDLSATSCLQTPPSAIVEVAKPSVGNLNVSRCDEVEGGNSYMPLYRASTI